MYFAITKTLQTSHLNQENIYDEGELLRQIAAGSEEAFRAVFYQYRGKLYSYILKIANSEAAAEDAVHDVFLKIWEGREKLPQIQNLTSYLFRIARNHAINGFRRMAKETLILAELRRQNVASFQTIDPITQKEIRTFIQDAVAKLSPQQRKVFILSRQDGLKHEEIAQKLGISINTVRVHMSEALRFLREEIGRSYGSLAVVIYVIYKVF